LDDTVHAVAATTGSLLATLQPALSIVGLHHDAPGSSFALGSNGQLDFGQAPAGVHELDNVTGGYTNYGIALNTSIGNIVHASSDMAVHADAISTSMLDNFSLDHQSGSALHMTSDALHLDQALLRLASDVLS
jgi:methylaspartate ammonia-lyase